MIRALLGFIRQVKEELESEIVKPFEDFTCEDYLPIRLA